MTRFLLFIFFLSCNSSRYGGLKFNAEDEELGTVDSRSGGARWAVVVVTHEDERSLAVG